jgi:hypothetical protein
MKFGSEAALNGTSEMGKGRKERVLRGFEATLVLTEVLTGTDTFISFIHF